MKTESDKGKETLDAYSQISGSYDQVMVWDRRLRSEELFFKEVFKNNNVSSVLDAGCGTGMHAIEFARWGLKVYGGDFSAEMLNKASQNAETAGVSPHFFTSTLEKMADNLPEKVDAITCIGTTLPHLLSKEALKNSIRDFYKRLNKGGVLLIQNVNFEKMYEKKLRFRPLRHWKEENEEKFFLRIYNFISKTEICVDMITVVKKGGEVEMLPETVNMRPIYDKEITSCVTEAGFSEYFMYGDYKKTPYDVKISPDLILLAKK